MFHPLKLILKENIQKHQMGRSIEAFEILKVFREIAAEVCGKTISEGIQPISYKEGIVTLSCVSPAYAQEITLRQEELLRKVNAQFRAASPQGMIPVKKIRFLL